MEQQTNRRRLGELLSAEFMARLDGLDVMSRKILQGKLQGERRSKQRGQSVEFADHRPYVAGDDLRFVDWNIYGRLEQLFLKLFMQELDLTVHLVFDATASMATGQPSKADFIRQLTAALGYVSLVNNNRVTISTIGDGVVKQMSGMRGRRYLPMLAEFLLNTENAGASNFYRACSQLATASTATGIMVVLSDFLFKEGYEEGLKLLAGRKYEIYAVQVLSPEEREPKLSGDLKLVDVEDRDHAEITASAALINYYKRNLAAYCNELKEFCIRRGMTYIPANSADAVETLVLNYLRRVKLLR